MEIVACNFVVLNFLISSLMIGLNYLISAFLFSLVALLYDWGNPLYQINFIILMVCGIVVTVMTGRKQKLSFPLRSKSLLMNISMLLFLVMLFSKDYIFSDLWIIISLISFGVCQSILGIGLILTTKDKGAMMSSEN